MQSPRLTQKDIQEIQDDLCNFLMGEVINMEAYFYDTSSLIMHLTLSTIDFALRAICLSSYCYHHETLLIVCKLCLLD